MKQAQRKALLETIFKRLYNAFGPQGWWPADSPFEVIVGAVLTQNTSWSNVEKAIDNLKKEKLLSPAKLKKIQIRRLARLIQPAGYYNQKAKRLKGMINFLYSQYGLNLKQMFADDYLALRGELLKINGIGLETADSILLYAGGKPLFVVDAYTRRMLLRHKLIDSDSTYSQIQNFFMDNLKEDPQLYNEFHALIVRLGKDICRKNPRCEVCPLRGIDKLNEN